MFNCYVLSFIDMKCFVYFISIFLVCDCIKDSVFEFGKNEGEDILYAKGTIDPTVSGRRTVVPYSLPPCTKMSYVKVTVHNAHWRPSVSVDAMKNQVVIFYRYNHNSDSTYEVTVKGVVDKNCSESNIYIDPESPKVPTVDDIDDGDTRGDEEVPEEEQSEPEQSEPQDSEPEEFYSDEIQKLSQKITSLTVAPPVPHARRLHNSGQTSQLNCEYCCPGNGCPAVFSSPPDARDFLPLDDESVVDIKNRYERGTEEKQEVQKEEMLLRQDFTRSGDFLTLAL